MIGYFPQNISLLPWKTVIQNINLGHILGTGNTKNKEISVKKLLKDTGMIKYINAYPHELSGGMQQRIALVRSLAGNHKLLCIDEPFSALDSFQRKELQIWLRKLLKENKITSFLVTHSIEEAIIIADTIYCLKSSPGEIFNKIKINLTTQERFNQDKSLERFMFKNKIEKMFIKQNIAENK